VRLTGPPQPRQADAPATFAALLQSRGGNHPTHRYIEIDHEGRQTWLSLAEQQERAWTLLALLCERGIEPRSDVVLCFESVLDLIPAMWACFLYGTACLPWHFQRTTRSSDIRSRLQTVAQKLNYPVLLTTDKLHSRLAAVPPSPFERTLSIEQARNFPAKPPLGKTAGMLLLFTSGTTGGPKIVKIDERTLLARHLSRRGESQNRLFNHSFEGLGGVVAMFPAPANYIYVQPDLFAAQPLELLRIAEEFEAQRLSMSSSLAARVIDAVKTAAHSPNLSCVKNLAIGGEMIVPNLVLKLGAMLREMGARDITMSLGYGMTEAPAICVTERLSFEEMFHRLRRNNGPASVGGCAPGWSLRIVDDAGSTLPEGADGNVEVWSENKLFSGYRNDPELTKSSFTEDGWFKTGDIGRVANGELTLTGRQKSIIIINARNISLEAIEAPLRELDGISRAMIAGAPVRTDNNPTDELALFFVPREGVVLDDLCRAILRAVCEQGLPVKHLVPVKEADFPLTPSGKVKRNTLIELYACGLLKPLVLPPMGSSGGSEVLTERQRFLAELWTQTLKLDFLPSLDENFFALGGDSLASAELIFAVEERFSCTLPIEQFFSRPTIRTLDSLLTTLPSPDARKSVAPVGGARLLHKLRSFSASWRGRRQFPDSFFIGFNLTGIRTPIVWITQEFGEAKALAKQLGPEQPFYVARSCVGIVSVKDYSTEVIETVTNRYLWEVLALPIRGPFILGGTCQGGIISLSLARRLIQIKRTPALLVLLEWSYRYGSYLSPTLLIYGEQSYTADIYKHGTRGPDWRADFPNHTLASVPGRHGEAAIAKASVDRLAAILTAQGDHLGATRWLKFARRVRRRLRFSAKKWRALA
jgi:acyl-CoA synthetase (AMP-forming)/AMP-acid ligase II/acyl carrier protein